MQTISVFKNLVQYHKNPLILMSMNISSPMLVFLSFGGREGFKSPDPHHLPGDVTPLMSQ